MLTVYSKGKKTREKTFHLQTIKFNLKININKKQSKIY